MFPKLKHDSQLETLRVLADEFTTCLPLLLASADWWIGAISAIEL